LDDYESAGPNFVVRIPGLPLEESGTGGAPDSANGGGRVPFGSQGLESIGATGDRSRWGDGVTVAVLDSGIEAHPSLGKAEITHVDLLKDGGEMNGHGTAMASLIAGNDANVGGVTPAARLLDIRVADSNGDSNTALLASGIVRATDLGARVINISLGTTGYSQVLAEAVQYAQSHNAVVVAAAGNEQQTALVWPAGFAGGLSVGAVDAGGTQAWFSNSGEGLTLVGPGVGIVSGYSDGKVVIGSGTSQATAITSGVVAQLMSRGYSSSSIIPMLTRTAKPLNAPASAVGAGLVQLPK
jgi:thermitase